MEYDIFLAYIPILVTFGHKNIVYEDRSKQEIYYSDTATCKISSSLSGWICDSASNS